MKGPPKRKLGQDKCEKVQKQTQKERNTLRKVPNRPTDSKKSIQKLQDLTKTKLKPTIQAFLKASKSPTSTTPSTKNLMSRRTSPKGSILDSLDSFPKDNLKNSDDYLFNNQNRQQEKIKPKANISIGISNEPNNMKRQIKSSQLPRFLKKKQQEQISCKMQKNEIKSKVSKYKNEQTELRNKNSKKKNNRIQKNIKKSLAKVINVYCPNDKKQLNISMNQITKDSNKQLCCSKNDFIYIEIIGEGGYGKVWKVQHIKSRKLYALKQMSKAIIAVKKSIDNVLNQRTILTTIKHNFIANIRSAFHDRDNLYLVMDLLPGGDLRSHLSISSKMNQEKAKFVISCIIIAIEYLHKNKIFHRDIKPQNLVYDQSGYLRLTDFGIARCKHSSTSLDTSGTPGYMAPEVLNKKPHSFPVDFYAIGVITYEIIMGKRPYPGNNRNQIRQTIMSKQYALKKAQLPSGYGIQVCDFVSKLLLRQQGSRLGSKLGVKELKTHAWLRNMQWNAMEEKKVTSPFMGKKTLANVTENMEQQQEAVMQYKILQKMDKGDIFDNYYFQFKDWGKKENSF